MKYKLVFMAFLILSCSTPVYAAATGRARLSAYTAPNLEKIQPQAATDWTLGVLGGDSGRLGRIFRMFRDTNIKEPDIANFLFLRQVCYPTSTWALKQADITGFEPLPKGMEVKFTCPDVEGRIMEAEKRFKRISDKEIVRVLAEWLVAYQIASASDRNMGEIEISRIAPVNTHGQIYFGPNQAKDLIGKPEETLIKTLKRISEENLKGEYIRRQINRLKAEIKHSSTINFSKELKEALGGVNL